MALRISGISNPTGIKATILAPTYQLTSNVNSVDEGNPVVFTLTTTNVPNGTQVPFTITGISSADVVSGQLTGNFTVNVFGIGTTTITVSEDAIADEVESLTMTIDGTAVSKTVAISDTTVLDQYSSYNAFLLTATGLNASNNNTFVDSSPNNFTITRNGNVTQGSLSPYLNYSLYTGIDDSLSLGTTPVNFGTSQFTIEFWLNWSGYKGSLGSNYVITSGSWGQAYGILGSIHIESDGNIQCTMTNSVGSGSPTVSITSTSVLEPNRWYHILVTRSGATVKLYVNGSSEGTAITSGWDAGSNAFGGTLYVNAVANNWYSSGKFSGYISNLRIVKNQLLVSGNFTVSENKLSRTNVGHTGENVASSITGTAYLFFQSGILSDTVSSVVPTIFTGAPSIVPHNPFPVSAYSPVTHGGSMYFDGTGDFLSIPTADAQMHQVGNWTYEGWVYFKTMPVTGWQNIFGTGNAGQSSFGMYVGNSAASTWSAPYKFKINQANIGDRLTGSATIVANTWYHFAVVRNAGVITLYVNGIADGTYSNNTDYTMNGNAFTVGKDSNAYISDFRFVRSAVYTSSFTLPSAPLTPIASTTLLLSNTNANIIDSTGKNVIETLGNAQVNTSVFKYNRSVYFDGVGDTLSIPKSPVFQLSGDFTIECWIKTNITWDTWISGYYQTSPSTAISYLIANYNGSCIFDLVSGGVETFVTIASATTIGNNSWHHIAVTRSGNTVRTFLNGTPSSTITYTLALDVPANAFYRVGGVQGTYEDAFAGYIEDLRITNGIARYTTTFTPPTAALPR